MIFVCEPQCKGMSHEKVNAGLLLAVRHAFPDQSIRFYAEESHYQAIRNIWKLEGVKFENIEHHKIDFTAGYSLKAYASSKALISHLMNHIESTDAQARVLFLSFNSLQLSLIKKAKAAGAVKKLKLTMVLHGELEELLRPAYQRLPFLNDQQTSLIASAKKRFRKLQTQAGSVMKPFFPLLTSIRKSPNADLHYLALAPYIVENLKNQVDTGDAKLFSMVLPTLFKQATEPSPSNKVKFAVFGYGYPEMLQRILKQLGELKPNREYEVRLISMDTRGLAGMPGVTTPGPGRQMTRSEMESMATDIDLFLILYEKGQYRLSCSASILEAISYFKPVLHFNNDCIDFFDRPDQPIGFATSSIDGFARKMKELIEDPKCAHEQLAIRRQNMLKLRQSLSLENAGRDLRKSMTF